MGVATWAQEQRSKEEGGYPQNRSEGVAAARSSHSVGPASKCHPLSGRKKQFDLNIYISERWTATEGIVKSSQNVPVKYLWNTEGTWVHHFAETSH